VGEGEIANAHVYAEDAEVFVLAGWWWLLFLGLVM
jgi:hypothetical protein